jgi:hypothetical protein
VNHFPESTELSPTDLATPRPAELDEVALKRRAFLKKAAIGAAAIPILSSFSMSGMSAVGAQTPGVSGTTTTTTTAATTTTTVAPTTTTSTTPTTTTTTPTTTTTTTPTTTTTTRPTTTTTGPG